MERFPIPNCIMPSNNVHKLVLRPFSVFKKKLIFVFCWVVETAFSGFGRRTRAHRSTFLGNMILDFLRLIRRLISLKLASFAFASPQLNRAKLAVSSYWFYANPHVGSSFVFVLSANK